ncbi:MAG: DNA alkylation repair protein [Candidatus Pacebacteria bacterium]|nr:DNA alkylation repair protein [Candidatus Paceibacterota bacterium]
MTTKTDLINQIKQELQESVDPIYRDREKSFSKEDYESYGVKTPVVRSISKKYYSEVKRLSKEQVFQLAEVLLNSKMSEEQTIAFDWAFRLKSKFKPADYNRFFCWLEQFVDTWFKCDDFCTHALGYLLYKYPQLTNYLPEWAKSDNRWIRRAAAVVLIYSLRRGDQLDSAFKIADLLLLDQDELVQKGYGWMLKESSKRWPKQVFEFVLARKDKMPRTALRYAIEKLSPDQRAEAMG